MFLICYLGSSFSSSTNPWFYLWILASVVSSCYAYTWDIKMDWGLMDSHPGDNKCLREEIVYSKVRQQLIVNVTNIFLTLLRIGIFLMSSKIS